MDLRYVGANCPRLQPRGETPADDIVVVARKRQERLVDVPIAVTRSPPTRSASNRRWHALPSHWRFAPRERERGYRSLVAAKRTLG